MNKKQLNWQTRFKCVFVEYREEEEAPKEKEQKGKAAEKKFYFITDLPIKKVRQQKQPNTEGEGGKQKMKDLTSRKGREITQNIATVTTIRQRRTTII